MHLHKCVWKVGAWEPRTIPPVPPTSPYIWASSALSLEVALCWGWLHQGLVPCWHIPGAAASGWGSMGHAQSHLLPLPAPLQCFAAAVAFQAAGQRGEDGLLVELHGQPHVQWLLPL
jgi:hypothetical protein